MQNNIINRSSVFLRNVKLIKKLPLAGMGTILIFVPRKQTKNICFENKWRDGRVVECGGLENR